MTFSRSCKLICMIFSEHIHVHVYIIHFRHFAKKKIYRALNTKMNPATMDQACMLRSLTHAPDLAVHDFITKVCDKADYHQEGEDESKKYFSECIVQDLCD